MKDDARSPEVLSSFGTEAEATLFINHLQSLGIKAYVSGASTPGWPEVPSTAVQVVVRQADLARAREALDRIRQMRPRNQVEDINEG